MILMESGRLEACARQAYDAIFEDRSSVEIDGETYHLEHTRGGLRKFSIEGITFMEQNPDKDSVWAEKAREGSQIMWAMKGRQYLARVMDGKFLKLK
jgi:hypothetical protein